MTAQPPPGASQPVTADEREELRENVGVLESWTHAPFWMKLHASTLRLLDDHDRALRLLGKLFAFAEYMGDQLNEMDAVEDEDLEAEGGVLEAAHAFLADRVRK